MNWQTFTDPASSTSASLPGWRYGVSSTTLPPWSVQCCSASVGSVAPLAAVAKAAVRTRASPRPVVVEWARMATLLLLGGWDSSSAGRGAIVPTGRPPGKGPNGRRVGWRFSAARPVDLSTRSVKSGVLVGVPAGSTLRTGERQPARIRPAGDQAHAGAGCGLDPPPPRRRRDGPVAGPVLGVRRP